MDIHFNPRYQPWDQRLCLVPDGDLFEAISAGAASIVTDRIETFTERGVRLRSGAELEADVIVTATGLNLLMLGGMTLEVDGREVSFPDAVGYKGMMLSGVPNLAFTTGYTNASWTLKADLSPATCAGCSPHGRRTPSASARPARLDPSIPTGRSSISSPAMCSARSTSCPGRATVRPGACIRTTR